MAKEDKKGLVRKLAETRAAKKDYKSSKVEAARVLGQGTTASLKDQTSGGYTEVRKRYEGKAQAAAAKLSPKAIDKMESSKKLRRETERAFQQGQRFTAKYDTSDPFTKKPGFTYQPPEKKAKGFGRLRGLGGLRMGGGGVPRVR
jgi:hypothetical protein